MTAKKIISLKNEKLKYVKDFFSGSRDRVFFYQINEYTLKYIFSISFDIDTDFRGSIIYCTKVHDKNYLKSLLKRLKSKSAIISACYIIEETLYDKEWLESIIENAVCGNPSNYACWMVKYHGSSREWAESVIENAVSGDPSMAAYLMVKNHNSSIEWAKSVVENLFSLTSSSSIACRMAENQYVSRVWAEKIIENCLKKIACEIRHHIYPYAYNMVQNCGSSKEWFKKSTERDYDDF